MAMNFWEAQRRARKETTIYLLLFFFLVGSAAALMEWALRSYAGDQYNPPYPIFGISFIAITCIAAIIQYSIYCASGGSFVAESMGGRRVDANTTDFQEKQLLNIVEEIAIASALPVPPVYIIPANQINAFAAGLTPQNACIAITEGSLSSLTRDEMQGVVAHEFGHIANGDMRIGLRLAALLMGFYFILYFGLRMMQFMSPRGRREGGKGNNPLLLAAILFVIAGVLTWFLGSLLKAAISRQREYLADASSVQFTRNPEGLISALEKIQKESIKDMPKSGMTYSHLYLDDHGTWSSIFATHPPLQMRIRALR